MLIRSLVLAAVIGVSAVGVQAESAPQNRVVGTWNLVSATIDPEGKNVRAYGEHPSGLLVFTPDMHFIVVLTDADTPRFVSKARGEGTDAENRAAMSRNIGFFGTYTVDENGEFTGNRVEGSTFPNWIGDIRTRRELTLTVSGDKMAENFQRPDGTRIVIQWERVR